jgi:hypothetical protein
MHEFFFEFLSSTSQLLSRDHHAEHLWRSSCLRASDKLLFLLTNSVSEHAPQQYLLGMCKFSVMIRA